MPAPAVLGGADLIVNFVNGYCLAMAAPITRGVDPHEALSSELAARPPDATPIQRKLAADPAAARRDSFHFGLDVILGGLEQLADAGDRKPSR